MVIEFTDNITKHLIDVLKSALVKAKEIRFGVAFVKYSGFSLIEDEIKQCLANKGKVEFLVGLDFRITDPRALRSILEMAQRGSNIKLFCFSDFSVNDTPVFHPKIYLARNRSTVFVSIGSSNLTAGGLRDNVEANTVIKTGIKDELVSDIYGLYNRFKFQKTRFEPDLAYVQGYEEAYDLVRKKNIESLKEANIANKIRKLRDRENVLPKPVPTGLELFGWQKLVYDRLPEGVFETGDMYAYATEFQQSYPQNRHVTDKVRQILQQLEDLGMLKHLGRNRWSRI